MHLFSLCILVLRTPICAGAYISWVNVGKFMWNVAAGGVGANALSQISDRPVPKEPMVGVYCHVSPPGGRTDFAAHSTCSPTWVSR